MYIQTSNTTAFILYELAKHQDIQQKLYDQVTYVLGETGEADSESLQKIPYLGNIIKETMRFIMYILKFYLKHTVQFCCALCRTHPS